MLEMEHMNLCRTALLLCLLPLPLLSLLLLLRLTIHDSYSSKTRQIG